MAFLGGLFGGGSASDVYIPPQLQPGQSAYGIPQTQQDTLAGIQGLGQYQTYDIPGAQQVTQGLMNNPGIPGYQQGAQVAGGMAQAGAGNQWGAGGSLYDMGGRVAQTAFDPQYALYNQSRHNLQEQQRAGQMARGIGTSPYGQGLEDEAMRKFEIDWQNQQLDRQLKGLSGTGTAYGQASNMQTQAPIQYLQGSAMPYGANQTIGTGQMAALGQMGQFGQQASQVPQQQIADWQNYLGYGNQVEGMRNQVEGLNNQRSQLALQQQGQDFGQNAAIWGGLGKAAGTGLGWAAGGPAGAYVGSKLFG